MPVQTLEEWFGPQIPSLPLSCLKDAVIGIDASYYLDLHLNKHSQEQLLNALGGLPFVLKSSVERELSVFTSHGITPIFVFNGLDFGGIKRGSAGQPAETSLAYEKAWEAYDSGNVAEVLNCFQKAGNSTEAVYKLLQKILVQNKVDFIVAPYSAGAQLAYLEKQQDRFLDAIMGSTDLFLFDIEKAILRIDFEQNVFDWLSRASCQERLDRVSDDTFRDALLLTGSQYMPIFPPLQRLTHGQKGASIRDALNMLNTSGRSVTSLCNQYREDQDVQNLQYADRYKKAVMTIKHHVIMESDGKVAPLDMQHAPGDVHEFIGQRLPEELYFYVSKGILSPRVPNWITSGVIDVTLAPGMADSEAYHKLMREQLVPIWTQSLSLLSTNLHRYYQTRSVSIKTYFNSSNEVQINLKEVPSVREQLKGWKIHEDSLPQSIKESQGETILVLAALNSVDDVAFAAKSLAKPNSSPISTKPEIVSNTLWRFLQLRNYISSEKHELTPWGRVLQTALASLDPADKLEDAVILAVEMIRFGLVNGNNMFPNVSGGPQGDDTQKKYSYLISRVACFGRLKHKSLGYSGPLSRQFLTYSGLVGAVRTGVRDLLEVVMAGLFLGADVDRNREDWQALGLSLPLADDNGCGLGVLTKTYFDQISQPDGDGSFEDHVSAAKKQVSEWFRNVVSFNKNLENAFKLWDAVYAGTKVAGNDFKDKALWDDADAWLKTRR